MITFALLCLAQIHVDGLKPNESFLELAPTVEPVRTYVISERGNRGFAHVFGRVVDAYTGQPVVGAVIETWTEEIDATAGGLHRLGEALSAEDGRFQILQGEKARIQAPGYLTWSGAGNALWTNGVELFPDPGLIPKIRIVDTSGRPIHNAVITSTRTCSHDLPMFEARTDSRGIALLRGFGLQDDIQDLRLRASGFAGTEYLNGKPALIDSKSKPGSKIYTVVMPRMERKIQLWLLDENGNFHARKAIKIVDGDCFHVQTTDKYGRLSPPFRYLSDWVNINGLRPEPSNPLFFDELKLVPPQSITLHANASDWPNSIKTGEIQLSLPEGDTPYVQFFHEDGWAESPYKKELQSGVTEFPAGKGFLHIGGSFNRFAEEWIEFKLGDGQTLTLEPNWVEQPKIRVEWPDDVSANWVQADEFTEKLDGQNEDLSVPANQSLVFMGNTDGKERFWEVLDPTPFYLGSESSQSLVLENLQEIYPSFDPTLLPPPADEIVFLQLQNELAEQGSWQLRNAFGKLEEPTPSKDEPNMLSFHAPRGVPVLGVWRLKDHLPCWFQVTPGLASSISLHPIRPASVEIISDLKFDVLGYESLSELQELYPGPLSLVLQWEDGGRLGLQLQLESGETRKLIISKD